ncbi:MAG: DNRLRE domain-containing protein [Promethearchaeota archaeon]
MNKKIVLGVVAVSLLFSFITYGNGLRLSETETTKYTDGSEDTYINSSEIYENYYTLDFLYIGNHSTGLYETYISFELFDYPTDNWTKAEVEIYVKILLGTTAVTASEVNEIWRADTLIWNNRPTNRTEITSFIVDEEDKIYSFDVSDLISGEYLLICLNATSIPTGYLSIPSSSDDSYNIPGPKIKFTYPAIPNGEEDESGNGSRNNVIAGYDLVLFLGIAMASTVFIYKIVSRRKKRYKSINN